jgi:MoxR-like ATPase
MCGSSRALIRMRLAVLFGYAVDHVTRLARTLSLPRGNAMLVGVAGTGRHSLARLAAHIAGCQAFQIHPHAGFAPLAPPTYLHRWSQIPRMAAT